MDQVTLPKHIPPFQTFHSFWILKADVSCVFCQGICNVVFSLDTNLLLFFFPPSDCLAGRLSHSFYYQDGYKKSHSSQTLPKAAGHLLSKYFLYSMQCSFSGWALQIFCSNSVSALRKCRCFPRIKGEYTWKRLWTMFSFTVMTDDLISINTQLLIDHWIPRTEATSSDPTNILI